MKRIGQFNLNKHEIPNIMCGVSAKPIAAQSSRIEQSEKAGQTKREYPLRDKT